MENGGGGNHFPWAFPDPQIVVPIYRFFVNVHMSLKPYFLNAGSLAWAMNISVMNPMAEEIIIPGVHHSWDYLLWTDILVCPIVEDKLSRTIDFPKGRNWVDFFNHSLVYQGGSRRTFNVPLSAFPAFQRQGSMIPLHVNTDESPWGDARSADCTTLKIALDPTEPSAHQTAIRHWRGQSVDIAYSWDGSRLSFEATPTKQECFILLVSGFADCPASAIDEVDAVVELPQVDTKAVLDDKGVGYVCESSGRFFVRLGDASKGHIVAIDV